jgi:hypothetical protein
MNRRCPEIERLAEVMRLPGSDPRRQHVDECPRCRARAALYQRFLDPGALPAGANLEDARRRMSAALEREIAGASADVGKAGRRPSFFEAIRPFFQPVWRPAMGIVGVAAAVLLIVRLTGTPGPGDGSPVLRERATASRAIPVLLQPIHAADHAIVLHWKSAREADAYQVILFGTDLREKARYSAAADTFLRLAPERLSELPQSLFWAVAALRGGDEIGRTQPLTLDLR